MIVQLIAAAAVLVASVVNPPATLVQVTATPFPGTSDSAISVGCTDMMRGLTLAGHEPFGGISAIAFSGDELILLSDRASHFRASPVWEDGWIAGFSAVWGSKLLDADGRPLAGNKRDSEAMIVEPDGSITISFENYHRISTFVADAANWREAELVIRDPHPTLRVNSGYEGIARLADGTLAAISEGTDTSGLARVLLVAPDGTQTVKTYRPGDEFGVTDLALDPATGDVFALERAFSRLKGPRARLVHIAAMAWQGEDEVHGRELARFNFFHGIDNMEGLTVVRRGEELQLYLIADDNFSDVQRTAFMGLRLVEDRPGCGL